MRQTVWLDDARQRKKGGGQDIARPPPGSSTAAIYLAGLSFSFFITSSRLKLAAFCRCG